MVAPAAHAQVVAPRPAPADTPVITADAIYKPALHQQAATPSTMTVYKGDTLSGIAGTACGNPGKWPSLYGANRKVIGSNPNLIEVGQKLALDCSHAPVSVRSAARVITTSGGHSDPFDGHRGNCGDGDHDGMDASCSVIFPHSGPTSVPQFHAVVQAAAGGTFHGNGGMQQCIISRESGGNSQVTNASGHYGLYQFSYSTWVGSGGNGADFGHASVGEQNQVFSNAVAARGYSDWAPYDGC